MESIEVACFLVQQQYMVGDPAPLGYLQQSEWAEAQYKGGLRQKQCGRCGKWKFPQELSGETDKYQARLGRKTGPVVTIASPVCLSCSNLALDHEPPRGTGESQGCGD